MSTRQRQKAEAFRRLHGSGTFVIPNAWDAGSARMLATLGFEALATTSSGHAFTLGRADGGLSLDDVVAQVVALDAATDLPVSVDLENGHGPAAADAAEAVRRIAAAGAVGGSIEDYDPAGRLYPAEEATERVAAAVEAARGLDVPFTLTARAENHLRGNPDLADTIARLQAYEAAGADVLYAPGLRTLDDVRTVCESVSAPVNVLAPPGVTVADLAAAGVRRISVGGALANAAYAAAAEAAVRIRDEGSFDGLRVATSFGDWL